MTAFLGRGKTVLVNVIVFHTSEFQGSYFFFYSVKGKIHNTFLLEGKETLSENILMCRGHISAAWAGLTASVKAHRRCQAPLSPGHSVPKLRYGFFSGHLTCTEASSTGIIYTGYEDILFSNIVI